jgi:hypothetical protein
MLWREIHRVVICSNISRGVDWQVVTDISGQPDSPVFRDQIVE